MEQELPLFGLQNALLQAAQLDLQYFLELVPLQRVKNDDFVEAVHKFRGKLAPGRFHGSAFHLFVKSSCRFVLRLDKTHAPLHQFHDFRAAQVRGHENHCL